MTGYDYRPLRAWRLESGMTPELVCVRAEVSYPHLRALEDGARSPSIAVLTRIAAVYGRDVRELFTDSDGDAELAGAR